MYQNITKQKKKRKKKDASRNSFNKLKIMDNTQNKSYRPYPVNYNNSNPFYFRQWSSQRTTSNFITNPRLGNYLYPVTNNTVRAFFIIMIGTC